MGISYRNGSGCADPTAFQAVRNMEREEKTLHIEYPAGYMDLYMNTFFPCTVDRARKVFKLMKAYSSEEDKQKLLRHLNMQLKLFENQKKSYAEMALHAETKGDCRKYTAGLKQAQVLQRRAQRNIDMLREVMK